MSRGNSWLVFILFLWDGNWMENDLMVGWLVTVQYDIFRGLIYPMVNRGSKLRSYGDLHHTVTSPLKIASALSVFTRMTRYAEFLRFIIPLLELRATPETSCLGVKFSVAGMNLKTPQISHKSSGFLGQKNTEIVTDHPRIYPWSRMVLISHMVKGVIGHPFWITPNILLKWSKRKSHCRPLLS